MWKKIAGALLTIGFAGLTWAQQIDLNKASEVELDALKGVGPVLTKELMNERKKAPFKDWEDATSRVKGLGPQKASSLSEQGVRVQGSPYTGNTAEKKPAKSDKDGDKKAKADTAKETAGKAKDVTNDSAKATAKSADATSGKAPPAKN